MTPEEYKRIREQELEKVKEYEKYLKIEQKLGSTWWVASQKVISLVDGIEKADAKDYKVINTLRKWYEEGCK